MNRRLCPARVTEKGDLMRTQVWLRRVIRKVESMNM